MCGIAGWIDPTRSSDGIDARVATALRHRGPDSWGVVTNDDVTMVHTRLSVLDLSDASSQPMWSNDGTVVVSFNGEIYNHHELRGELESRGHRLASSADTAVIAPLYQELGIRFVERLRGMFAIALHDLRSGRLVLCRDRFGIKPLYWTSDEARFAFSSELPALRLLPWVDKRLDEQAIFDFTALHFIPPPRTMHRGIHALEPGCLLVAEQQRERTDVVVRRYHQHDLSVSSVEAADAARHLNDLLHGAVTSQLESDVPLGALLSGGIDSTLVCAHAVEAEADLRTFGVSFSEEVYDEGGAILATSQVLGTRHTQLTFPDRAPSWEGLTELLRSTGQPFADSSILAVDAICALVREHVTVALSGDGGDEAHAGYDHFARALGLAPLATLPAPIRRSATPLLRAMTRIDRLAHFASRGADVAACSSMVELAADQITWVRAHEQLRLWHGTPQHPTARLFEPQWPTTPARGSVDQLYDLLTEADIRLRLAGDYLPKVDMASMRHSLEVRVPMLSEDLFDYALRLPRELKRRRGTPGKLLLRELAAARLPAIARRPKQGFSVPLDRWLRQHPDALRATLLDDPALGSLLDMSIVRQVVEAVLSGQSPAGQTRAGTYQRALMLLSLETHLNDAP